jgi:membrane protease YdiL (CAAX protease family)
MSSDPSSFDRRLTTALLAVAMTFPTLMAWLYFKQLGGQAGTANWLQQAAYTGGKIVQFALPVLWLWLTQRKLWATRRPRFTGWPVGVGFGLLVSASILALYFGHLRGSHVLAHTPEKLRAKLQEFGIDTPAAYLALASFIVVIHSLLEEYYWRWFVFGRLRMLIPFGAAVTLSSLAFMSHHVVLLDVYLPGRFFSTALPFSLCIAVGGAVWAWLYARADSVWSPWLSHALIDGALIVIGWEMVFRSG